MKEQIAQLERQLHEEKMRTKTAFDETRELKGQLDDTKGQLGEAQKSAPKKATPPEPVYIANRRLDRFKGNSDERVSEWIEDVRMQLATRSLSPSAEAAFILDHLSGNARQEILGRGCKDPSEIYEVLRKVFGTGDTLPVLQQKFFSYSQGDKEDLVTCSLRLVELCDRICTLDPAYKSCREATLKGRLAESVRDENLRRELRRLNMEKPDLTFFELRDRGTHWIGNEEKPKRSSVVNNEVPAIIDTFKAAMLEQAELLKTLMTEVQDLKSKPNSNRPYRPRRGPRLCYICQSPDHMQRECPNRLQGPAAQNAQNMAAPGPVRAAADQPMGN